jgi:hypothetical protein
MRVFVAVFLLSAYISAVSIQYARDRRFDPNSSCGGLRSCGQCTNVNFCVWHKYESFCMDADSAQHNPDKGSFIQHSCDVHDENEDDDAARFTAAELERPVMMQPPNVATDDEAHIFQGAFPKPDYGMGELGYVAYGLDAPGNYGQGAMNTPRNECAGDPLHGCLEKPVIVPRGSAYHGGGNVETGYASGYSDSEHPGTDNHLPPPSIPDF